MSTNHWLSIKKVQLCLNAAWTWIFSTAWNLLSPAPTCQSEKHTVRYKTALKAEHFPKRKKNLPTKYASFTLKGYFALPLIPYLNGFAPGEEIFSINPSRREGHYCPNPLTRSHFKTGVFGGWDGVFSSLSHPKSFLAGESVKAAPWHLLAISLQSPPLLQCRTSRKANKLKGAGFSSPNRRRGSGSMQQVRMRNVRRKLNKMAFTHKLFGYFPELYMIRVGW